MASKLRVEPVDYDPFAAFEDAATRSRARYQNRLDDAAELARRQAVVPAAVDPKYSSLPKSGLVEDRRGGAFDPYLQLTGLTQQQWKLALDYFSGDPNVRAEVARASQLAHTTPNWRQRVPEDLGGELPSQAGFFDLGNWHKGGIGSR